MMRNFILPILVCLTLPAHVGLASDIYNSEINALRQREAIYAGEMKLKYAMLLELKAQWQEVGKTAEMVESAILRPASKESSQEGEISPFYQAYFRLIREQVRLQSISEKLALAEKLVDRDFEMIDTLLRTGGFDETTPEYQFSQTGKAAVRKSISENRAKTQAALEQVAASLKEMQEHQRQALIRSQLQTQRQILSNIEFMHQVFAMNRHFRQLLIKFERAILKQDLEGAEEYLVGFEWLREKVPLYFVPRIDSERKQADYDLFIRLLDAAYSRMLDKFHNLRGQKKKSGDNSHYYFSDPRTPADLPISFSFGDGDGDEDSDPEWDFEIPDEMGASNSCHKERFEFEGKEYFRDAPKDQSHMKYFQEATETRDVQSSLAIEFGGIAQIVDREPLNSGNAFRQKAHQQFKARSWNKTQSIQQQNAVLSDLPAPPSELPSESEILHQTHRLAKMADGARGRTHHQEHRKELEDYQQELDRFGRFQEQLDQRVSAVIPEVLNAPVETANLWNGSAFTMQLQIPENPFRAAESTPELQAELDRYITGMLDLAAGVVSGTVYDAANFVSAVAFDHDILGTPTDNLDKALLGAAVVIGLIQPAGAKGPVLRGIRSALKEGKITKEAATGLQKMAKAEASIVGEILNGSPATVEGIGQLARTNEVRAVSSNVVNALETGGIPPFPKDQNLIRITVAENSTGVKHYRLGHKDFPTSHYSALEHPKSFADKKTYMDKMGMDLSKSSYTIFERTFERGDVMHIGPAAPVPEWGSKGGGIQARTNQKPPPGEWRRIGEW